MFFAFNDKREINNLPVILSAGRSPKSNFCGVNNEAEAQGVAVAGYGLKSRWLTKGMLHLPRKTTQTPSHIPSSHSLLDFTSLLAR